MEVKAKAKYIRMSPRKVRLVVDLIRGLDLDKAYAQLSLINKAAARPVEKLLNSAEANAHHNFEIEKDNLYIKEIRVDEGPVLQRWKARAYGRATEILRRSSHVNVVLEEKVPSKAKAKKSREKKEERAKPDSVQKEELKEKKGPQGSFDAKRKVKHRDKQHSDKKAEKEKGLFKKVFKRKSGT